MAEQKGANPLAEALSAAPGDTDVVKRALQAVRSHLGMKVAYVSEIVEGRSVFREVDAPGLEAWSSPEIPMRLRTFTASTSWTATCRN